MAVVGSSDRYYGLSTDVKPTLNVSHGEFFEIDTGSTYIWNNSSWVLAQTIDHAGQTYSGTLSVASGGTLASGSVDSRVYGLFGFTTPATVTSSGMLFQVSRDNVTFLPLYDGAGARVSVAIAASRAYPVPEQVGAYPYWTLEAGTAEGGSRVFGVVAKT